MSKLFVSSCLFMVCQICSAQSPSRLTTDLIEHTDQVFQNGYLSSMILSELDTATEKYQNVVIHSEHPLLGWVVNSNEKNTLQTAYRILVASTREKLIRDESDIWDSGKVEGSNSIAVSLDGVALQPLKVYYWKVKTWDNHGNESPYSEIKSFMTAAVLDNKTAQYPLQITDEYPIKILPVSDNETYVAFDKAAFGRLRLTLKSKKEQDTVLIRLGEKSLNGRVDRKPGGSIRYAEYRLALKPGVHTYTIKIRPDKRNTNSGRANESKVLPVFMPDYIGEVYPFRFCEIAGYSYPLTEKNIVRQSVHYPFDDSAANFNSSDSVLNKVWDLCKYSIKATSFMGTYVDGDRERIAYEADALINQLGHYAVDRKFCMARHSHEYLLYNPTWPTEWNLQSLIMAWNDYLYTGNKVSLLHFYEDLKAKTLLRLKEENGLISTRTGKLTPELYESLHFRGKKLRDIVDWPQNGVIGNEKELPGEADGYVRTTYNTVVNAYHYEAVKLLASIASAIGEVEDRKKYAREAEQIKKQFNKLLLDTEKGCYKDGVETEHTSLHANMFPMAFDMVPEKWKRQVMEYIKSRRMACSVYGSQFLMDALYNNGEGDYAFQLLVSTGERSWYNMLRAGSTITMEAWDNKYKLNQDWNHAWGAVPANIIPRGLFGIQPLKAGFETFRIKPQLSLLDQASLKLPTIRGDIEVSCVKEEKKRLEMVVSIPANSKAEVWVPRITEKAILKVDGVKIKGRHIGEFVIVDLGSGRFHLEMN